MGVVSPTYVLGRLEGVELYDATGTRGRLLTDNVVLRLVAVS